MGSNTVVAKNTLYLYVRMFVLMIIALYTSRVVIRTLGAVDYGIYNVVAGFITFFFFINSSLSSAVTRFLSYEIGSGNVQRRKMVFTISILLFVVIALVILLLSETLGVWFLENKINIPPNRRDAAFYVFQWSVVSAIWMFLQIPFSASFLAYERMSIYTWTSIIEGVCKLSVVLSLVHTSSDKLVMYAFLNMLVSLMMLLIYWSYCTKHFNDFKWQKMDIGLARSIVAYSGWNFTNGMADMVLDQGVNLLLNQFFGPVVNAARAIGVQVRGQLAGLVSNFHRAASPAITKKYAAQDLGSYQKMVFFTSKMSFFLLMLTFVPVLYEIPFLLDIWLGKGMYPDLTVSFVRLILLITFFDTLGGLVHSAILSTGKVKRYLSLLSLNKIITVIFCYVTLLILRSPIVVYYVMIFFTFISVGIVVYMGKKTADIDSRSYMKHVLLRDILAGGIVFTCAFFLEYSLNGLKAFPKFLIFTSTIEAIAMLTCFFVGLTLAEQKIIFDALLKKIKNLSRRVCSSK